MTPSLRLSGLIAALLLAPLFMSTSAAQQDQKTPTAEQQLIERVKKEVMEELRQGEFLRQQIQLGIKDFIKKQKQAKVAARAARQRLANERAKNVRRVSRARDHIYGDPNAPISLIEYSDFECPYCKRFHPTAKKIVETYAGKVNWVYRHFPLRFHNPGAQKQAEASECANALGGNDAFWKFTDAIYARTRSNGKGFPLTKLTPLATEIGLDGEKFQHCLDSGKQAARVNEDTAEAARIGVTGTPATIILHNQTGETRLKTGAQPLAVFKAVIDKMLN